MSDRPPPPREPIIRASDDPLPAPRSAEGVANVVRRSLVGVRSPSSSGAGWVALPTGLVFTSQEAVAFHTMVDLDLGGDQRVGGRVIWVDVAHDLAAILPVDALRLPPLAIRPDLPRPGEPAFVASFASGEPFRLTSALVAAVDCRFGSLRCFELDGPNGPSGSPIVDAGGRVIGIAGLDLPRGTKRSAKPVHGPARALPAATLSRVLADFDVDRGGPLEARTPMYACPTCHEPFSAVHERCIGCGGLLPHAWEAGSTTSEHLVGEILAALGTTSASARTGRRSWRIIAPAAADAGPRSTQPMVRRSVEVVFELDEAERTLTGRTPIVRLPSGYHEPFFRFLLTLNDSAAMSFRFALDGRTVYLLFVEPIAALKPVDATALFRELVRLGEHYRKALSEPFDTQSIGEADM